MKIKEVFSYRHLQHDWVPQLIACIKEVPEDIFFEEDGSPLKGEVKKLDKLLSERLITKFGKGVKRNFRTMAPENQFEIDIVLPTKPMTLIEIEKGKLPRLELDIMKILGSIWRFPEKYGFGCIIVPANYIKLKLAGNRSPYQYVTDHLIPLNRPVLDFKNEKGCFLLKDFIVIGYVDPRGERMESNPGKKSKYLVCAEMGLVDDSVWEGPLDNYPTKLIRLIRKQLKEKVPGLTEKFNTNSRYFGYSTGKDRAYIYVQKDRLRIDLDISRDFEANLKEEGFEVHFINNFQGKDGWLTGWRVPHTTSIERVMKWLLKAFNEDE